MGALGHIISGGTRLGRVLTGQGSLLPLPPRGNLRGVHLPGHSCLDAGGKTLILKETTSLALWGAFRKLLSDWPSQGAPWIVQFLACGPHLSEATWMSCHKQPRAVLTRLEIAP